MRVAIAVPASHFPPPNEQHAHVMSAWQKSVHKQSGVALHVGERTSVVRFDSHSKHQYDIVPTGYILEN